MNSNPNENYRVKRMTYGYTTPNNFTDSVYTLENIGVNPGYKTIFKVTTYQ